MYRNGMSPATTTSPVTGAFPDAKAPARASPAPSSAPRPASSRARQNSIQSNADNSRGRPPSSAPINKTNGHGAGAGASTPEQASTAPFPKVGPDGKPFKEAGAPTRTTESIKKETEKPESGPNATITTPILSKRDSKPEEANQNRETAPPPVPTPVTTKSGRASKPSTPALATFQEAAASRSRPSRAAEGNNSRKSHKKSGSVAQQALIQQAQAADTDTGSSMQGDDDEGDIDADEPTYCYCNNVSYGEMVACDADGCEKEWFHLACVGLKVAPGSKSTY